MAAEFPDKAADRIELGDPATDPPTIVRVESWERRLDPTVRRVVKTDNPYDDRRWRLITGIRGSDLPLELNDYQVRNWPIVHPITYSTAFQHSSGQQTATKDLDGSDAEGSAPFKDVKS